MNDAQLLRYSRHILLNELGIEGQEALLASHALVIGAGGLGSPVCLYLGSAGVGRITVVDDDVVDETNLQRQLSAPQLARVGRSYEIGFRGAAGPVRRLIPILLSPRSTRVSLGALGFLGIDPATSITLPPIPMAAGATEGTLQIALPNQTALVGLEFFLQGFDTLPGALHLT